MIQIWENEQAYPTLPTLCRGVFTAHFETRHAVVFGIDVYVLLG